MSQENVELVRAVYASGRRATSRDGRAVRTRRGVALVERCKSAAGWKRELQGADLAQEARGQGRVTHPRQGSSRCRQSARILEGPDATRVGSSRSALA
jgi:hypothetical protein